MTFSRYLLSFSLFSLYFMDTSEVPAPGGSGLVSPTRRLNCSVNHFNTNKMIVCYCAQLSLLKASSMTKFQST